MRFPALGLIVLLLVPGACARHIATISHTYIITDTAG